MTVSGVRQQAHVRVNQGQVGTLSQTLAASHARWVGGGGWRLRRGREGALAAAVMRSDRNGRKQRLCSLTRAGGRMRQMLQIIGATTKPPTSTTTTPPLFYHHPSARHEQPEVVLDGESQASSRISRRGAAAT